MLQLGVDDYLITTTTAEREGGQVISHPPHTNTYSLTHTQHERPDQAPSRTTDDYRFIRQIVSGFGLRTPPSSQPQVPAPACLPSGARPLPRPPNSHYIITLLLLPPTPATDATTNYHQTATVLSRSHTHPLSRHPSSTTPTTTHSLTNIHPTPPTTNTMYLLTSTIPQPSCARMPTL